MKQKAIEFYPDLDKAIDRAVWLQFKHRRAERKFVVYDGPEDNYAVSDVKTAKQIVHNKHFYPLVQNYNNLSFERLQVIGGETEMLEHWEGILGKFSVMEGEILRFILRYDIPLKKIIRFELGNRGFDENNQWIGFKASTEFWQNYQVNIESKTGI